MPITSSSYSHEWHTNMIIEYHCFRIVLSRFLTHLIFWTFAADYFFSMLLPNIRIIFDILPLPTRLFSWSQMVATLSGDKTV